MTRAWIAVGLTLSLLAVAACEKHGKYTQEFLDEATRDMLRMRAAMHFDTAAQQFESGSLDAALESVEGSIALDPGNAMGHLLRGRILIETGQTRAAVVALERGESLDPSDPLFPYYLAVALERLDRLEETLAAYRRAAALDPGTALYPLGAAETLVELDRPDEARALLEEADAAFDAHPALRQMLGHVAMLQGRHDDAVRCFREATVLQPQDPVLREDLCFAQIAAGRFAEAEATLRRLAGSESRPQRRDLRHLHARCLIELDRPIEARTVLFEMVRSAEGGQDVEAWVKLVDVALMLRDDGLLQTAAYRLMSTAPSRYEGYLAMALWQRRTGDVEGALRSVERAIKRAGDEPAARNLRDLLHRELAAR